ncbi:MAG: CatB-related O-acetyltransferase [Clostridiales Family XIII bacterium]|jgi:virginiamycin A acetyltransferase|nr:CatB-related O-acetyltransferase [Clostridiales Family XIII bacterium]
MTENGIPDPNVIFPVPGLDTVTYVKPTIKRKNIIVGDFTYFSGADFESHVTHHYDFYGDRLIIGKFCQIATGVEFMMNGANHQMNAITTFPFYIFEGFRKPIPPLAEMPLKGDTVIGNDVWIGQYSTVLPGVHIGSGAIVGADSTVGRDVEPYSVVAGNPARLLRKRFDDELIALLLAFKWWDRPLAEINRLIPVLTDGNLDAVREKLKKMLRAEKQSDEASCEGNRTGAG